MLRPVDIKTDNTGNILITGNYSNTQDFAGTILEAEHNDIFIHKMNSTGNSLWTRRITGADAEFARSLAIDATGQIYVAGTFGESITAGGFTMPAYGPDNSYDMFITKLSTEGNFLWLKTATGTGAEEIMDLQFFRDSLYATGFFTANLDIEGTSITTQSQWNGFIVKYGTDGSFGGLIHFPVGRSGSAGKLHIDSKAYGIVAGHFTNTISVNNQSKNSYGYTDFFFARVKLQ